MPCRNCSCPSCLALAGSPLPPTELPLPPPELMTTNRAPTDSEVAESRDVIDSAKRKISLIQVAMVDLAEQMSNIRRVIEMHEAAIAPLRGFPPELLVAIFLEYLDTTRDPCSNLTSPKSLFMLTRICSRWRKIVLDTPQFWTEISDSTPMVDVWVNRSKELPLVLDMKMSSGDANLILDALIPQAHRWEEVHFTLHSNSNSVLSPVRGRLRSLRFLQVSCVGTIDTLDFCKEAPQMTGICLEGIFDPFAIKLPWEQLRVGTLCSSIITLYTLRQAKNIQTCFLYMEDHPRLGSRDWLPIPIPQDPHINSFFSSLTLLCLQIFALSFPAVKVCPPELVDTLFGFFKRSSLHLTTLTLTSIPFPSSNLINWLTLMPSLVSLCVKFSRGRHGFNIDDSFLDRLKFDYRNHLLPCLSSLTLLGKASFCEESLDSLITSRRDIDPQNVGVVPLAELVVDCTNPQGWSRNRLPSFHRFVSEGLDIKYGSNWDIGHPAMTMIDSDGS